MNILVSTLSMYLCRGLFAIISVSTLFIPVAPLEFERKSLIPTPNILYVHYFYFTSTFFTFYILDTLDRPQTASFRVLNRVDQKKHLRLRLHIYSVQKLVFLFRPNKRELFFSP